ncbi:helix-turn-helix domain-containing protein [Allopusillimonas ginsengisoli]|uniref:helix-turn-helix domain-containing protein n=1 Tax=Allopusillimonas ginsengisoli TaxID=453575 RepID=UPI0010226140|nr:helix-turn-helix transcriptional regulator [Allopusillimonas ginsengisoli]TEA71930.1 XRE family transcriptional regulator [Allopusillimonas ginsengisoli]
MMEFDHTVDPILEQLVSTRKERKITQAQLAELARVSRRALVSIEAGGDCTLSTLRRLLQALDLDLRVEDASYNPPTLEDVYAENSARMASKNRRPKP